MRFVPEAMTTIGRAWQLFKGTLSVAVVSCGTWIFAASILADDFWFGLACFSVLLFVATTPWVFGRFRHGRAFGLSGIFAGILAVIVANMYLSSPYVPTDCTAKIGREKSSCLALNWLYDLGGNDAIVFALFGVSALIFFVSYVMLVRKPFHPV